MHTATIRPMQYPPARKKHNYRQHTAPYTHVWHKLVIFIRHNPSSMLTLSLNCTFPDYKLVLGQVQMPSFTWAESNPNEKNPLFSLISIRFDLCEVRRLNLALAMNQSISNEIKLMGDRFTCRSAIGWKTVSCGQNAKY